jgi:hypothetical protein
MSVAAANEWYHAERRVITRRQRSSGRVQRRQQRRRQFESFGQKFFLLSTFFALCIMKKAIFAIENNFKGFLKKKSLKNDCFIEENIIEKEVTYFVISYMILDDIRCRNI